MGELERPNERLLKIANTAMKPMGLVLPADLTYEDWAEVGKYIKYIDDGVKWWMGDWLAFGEHKHGEKYRQAESETGLEYDTLRRAKQISERVEFGRSSSPIYHPISLSFSCRHSSNNLFPFAISQGTHAVFKFS